MKSQTVEEAERRIGSPPSRGAWIEISSPARAIHALTWSPPSRGAWIEIETNKEYSRLNEVAPLAGGVD